MDMHVLSPLPASVWLLGRSRQLSVAVSGKFSVVGATGRKQLIRDGSSRAEPKDLALFTQARPSLLWYCSKGSGRTAGTQSHRANSGNSGRVDNAHGIEYGQQVYSTATGFGR